MRGYVKYWLSDRGHGFIIGEDGNDYFVHHTDIIGQPGRKNLIPFANINFEPAKNVKGLKASKVSLSTE